jgi:hypothetical protein
MPTPCYLLFRHRCVLRLSPLVDLLFGDALVRKVAELHDRAKKEQSQTGPFADDALSSIYGPMTTTHHPLGEFEYLPGWYGVEQNQPICARRVIPETHQVLIEFNEEMGVRVRSDAVDLQSICNDSPTRRF